MHRREVRGAGPHHFPQLPLIPEKSVFDLTFFLLFYLIFPVPFRRVEALPPVKLLVGRFIPFIRLAYFHTSTHSVSPFKPPPPVFHRFPQIRPCIPGEPIKRADPQRIPPRNHLNRLPLLLELILQYCQLPVRSTNVRRGRVSGDILSIHSTRCTVPFGFYGRRRFLPFNLAQQTSNLLEEGGVRWRN